MSIRQRNAHFKDWAAVCKALSLGYSTDEVANEATARTALESSDNQFYYYVCYIKSAQIIYTHGEFYDCSYGKDEEAIAAALSSLATTKVGADNLKTINGESLVGAGDINTEQVVYDSTISFGSSQHLFNLANCIKNGYTISVKYINRNGYEVLTGGSAVITNDNTMEIRWITDEGLYMMHSWTALGDAYASSTSWYGMYNGNYQLSPYKKYDVSFDVSGGNVINPNCLYNIPTIEIQGNSNVIDIVLADPGLHVPQYMFYFDVTYEYTSLQITPNSGSISWANDDIPVLEVGYTYHINIVDNCAVYAKFLTPTR